MQAFSGMRVVVSEHAKQYVTRVVVMKHPTPKRRRRWRAVKVTHWKSGAYQTPQGLVVHPEIYEQLMETQRAQTRKGSAS